MLASIVYARGIMQTLPLVHERCRGQIRRYLMLHRGLMIVFLIGYLLVAAALCFGYALIGEFFVSVIFLLGAIFVLIGALVQSRLLTELQATLKGILPICSKCKKIRNTNGDPSDHRQWKDIEVYISEKTDADFSHGYCPICYSEELENICHRFE